MSSDTSLDDDQNTKQTRLQHPSGWLALTRHEAVPVLVDALLDLPPGREFTVTEFADHSGLTRQTVAKYLDHLRAFDLVERVPETSPQRHRLADSDAVEALLAFNGALNAAGGGAGEDDDGTADESA